MQNPFTLMVISFYTLPNFKIMFTANLCTWTDNIAVQNFVCNDVVASIWVIVPSKCSIKFELYVKSWMTSPYCCERNVGHAAGTVMIHTKCNYYMVPKCEGIKSLHNEPVHGTCCSSGGFLWFHVTNPDQQSNSTSYQHPLAIESLYLPWLLPGYIWIYGR